MEDLGPEACFRTVWLEARKRGVLSWNRSVRKYLDLLLAAGSLSVKRVRVKAPRPKEAYKVTGRKPVVFVGLRCLQDYGLAWEAGEGEIQSIVSDLEGVVRGHARRLGSRTIVVASLEDCLIHELLQDAKRGTGHAELVASILATRTVDLPYLLRRADRLGLGRAFRLLLRRLERLFGSRSKVGDLASFMSAREKFLRAMRNYASSGVDKLIEEEGRGTLALRLVKSLSDEDLLAAAGKQLGARG
ncbi:MAG: hypothetical protein QXF24_08625 [Thermoproteota archaeon]